MSQHLEEDIKMNSLSQYRTGRPRLMDEATQGLGGLMPPRVSIDGNRFTLIDPSGNATQVPSLPEGPALDIVFVDANPKVSKIYWGRGFQPNAAAPPLCFSDNGEAPSIAAQEPQHATCQGCPHNVIGSAVSQFSGAKIKACQDFRKLAVVVRGYPGVYQFTVKPGSFRNFQNYSNYLRMQKLPDGAAPDLADVVTRVTFASQGVMAFDAISLTPSDLQEQIVRLWEGNATGAIVGKTDTPIAPRLGGPQPQPRPAGVAPPPPQQGGLPPAQPFDAGPIPASLQRPAPAPTPPPAPPRAFPSAQPAAGVAPPWDHAKASEPASAAPAKRTRRTKAEMEAARASEAATGQTQPVTETHSPQHGLVEPSSPTPEMLSRLNAAFNLPTK